MTNIEQKALELVNEVLAERVDCKDIPSRGHNNTFEALCRAIERHEAFRQEVSDAVTALLDRFIGDSLSQGVINGHLHSFVIRKPDLLVETLKDMRSDPTPYINSEIYAERLRAALAKRGLEIREKSDD